MSFFDVLNLIGGLCLFLFGMSIMGDALERCAGNKLNLIIGRFTTGKIAGLLTGLGVTAIIQSSSATTVMVVGFVNSGLMTLRQSVNVIMGANVGTTVTAWILSLGGIESSNFFVQLLKPTSFTPVLALIGIIMYMFFSNTKKRDIGAVFLGFAVLMFGMDTMSASVSGLADVPEFRNLFVLFKNPILGVLAGALLTAIIQSSSASVGILQALTVTGQISYGAALPIIMGQNIGTCITAILSSFGANRNAKRVAVVHLSFNIIGTVVLMTVLYLVQIFIEPVILDVNADHFGIAVCHSLFNIVCTAFMLPLSGFLEKLVYALVPEKQKTEKNTVLDERLLQTPSVALEHCRTHAFDMAKLSAETLKKSLGLLKNYDKSIAEEIVEAETEADHYEDIIGNYLVKLSSCQINPSESSEAAELLKIIGDFERISDHAVNISESAAEMKDKEIVFTPPAMKELDIISRAIVEIIDLTMDAVLNRNTSCVSDIEALEEITDRLKEQMRNRHISRMQKGECSIEAGLIWSDLLTNLERTSDHCSNIAECVTETAHNNLNVHKNVKLIKSGDEKFTEKFNFYTEKYMLSAIE